MPVAKIDSFYSHTRVRLCLWVICALVCIAGSATAQTITLTGLDDINFGTIEFTQPVSGQVRMGTNGSMTYDAAYSGSGTGQAGRIEIDVTAGTTVEISCDNQATLTDSSANTLTMNGEIALAPGTIAGSGTDCTGISNVVLTHTVATGTSILHTAGALNPPGALTSGTYRTQNTSGAPLSVRVVVQ